MSLKRYQTVLLLLIAVLLSGCSSAADQAVEVYRQGSVKLRALTAEAAGVSNSAALQQLNRRYLELLRSVRNRIREIRSTLTRESAREFIKRASVVFKEYRTAKQEFRQAWRSKKRDLER